MKSSTALQAQKLNKFVLYVSSIALCLFGILYSFGEVKAEVAYQSVPYSGGNITIPSYEGDSMLLCFSAVNSGYFTINSATSTNLFTYDNGGYPYVMGTVDYYLNPTIGNNTFSASNSYYDNNCYLITGINSSDPYTLTERDFFDGYNSSFSNPTVLSNISATSSNSFLFSVSYGQDFNNVVWSLSDYTKIRQSQPSNYGSSMSFFRVSDLEASSYSFSWSNSAWALMKYYEIEFNEASVSSNDYILYYGNNPSYTLYGSNFNLPVVYDFCDSYNASSTYSIKLVSSDDYSTFGASQSLSSCSGSITYNPFSWFEKSDSVQFVIIDDEDDSSSLSEEDIVISSNSFLASVYSSAVSSDSYILYSFSDDYVLDSSISSSTDLVFSYDVCSDESYLEGSFCIVGEDEGNDYSDCSFSLETEALGCRGQHTMEFFPYSGSHYYKIKYLGSGGYIFSGSIFNFTYIEEGYSSDLFFFASPLNSALNKFVGVVRNFFPFNIITLFITAWSDTSELTQSFHFLSLIDENNDIVVSLPVSIFGSDKTFVLFGPSILGENQAMIDFFDDLRSLSAYFLVALFFFSIYRMSKKFLREINS